MAEISPALYRAGSGEPLLLLHGFTNGVIDALAADCDDLALRELEKIACPVRLASPQFDRVLPGERHAPRFRREIPGVESLILAGCGHVPMWDDARLVTRTITEFVDRHAAGAAPAVGLAST